MNNKIAWLAGIFEGEGCLHMARRKNRKSCVKISMNISNTDIFIIQECKSIIDAITGKDVAIIKHTPMKYHSYRKVIHRVWVYAFDSLNLFLTAISPYVIGNKKLKVNLMLQFIERRKSMQYSDSKKFRFYNEIDDSFFSAWDAINHTAESVETIRSLSQVDNDIVRAMRINKGMEISRNDLSVPEME